MHIYYWRSGSFQLIASFKLGCSRLSAFTESFPLFHNKELWKGITTWAEFSLCFIMVLSRSGYLTTALSKTSIKWFIFFQFLAVNEESMENQFISSLWSFFSSDLTSLFRLLSFQCSLSSFKYQKMSAPSASLENTGRILLWEYSLESKGR